MENTTQERLDEYVSLLEEIQERVGDERASVTILSEISKDRRMDAIRMDAIREDQERRKNGYNGANGNGYEKPATAKQKYKLDSMGIRYWDDITLTQASILIRSGKLKEDEQE